MAIIPGPWLIGKNLTSVVVTVQSVASDGTLTDSSGADIATLANGSMVGLVDEISLQGSKLTEDISSVTETKANHVAIARQDSMTLTEILRQGTTSGPVGQCLLANVWTSATSRYVKIAFTRGGNSWTGYFVLVGYEESIRRGKSTGRLTVSPIDPGQLNASFA